MNRMYLCLVMSGALIVSSLSLKAAKELPSDSITENTETCIVSESEQDPFAIRAEGSHQEAGAKENCVVSEDEQEAIVIAHPEKKEAKGSLFAPLTTLIKKIGSMISGIFSTIASFFTGLFGKK